MGTFIDVTLSEQGADAARVDVLHRQLLDELRQVDSIDAQAPSPGEVEPGSRGLDPATLSTLAVAILGSGGLSALIASLRGWLGRGHDEPRSVRLEIGGDVIELSGASSDEQDRLLAVFLARHEAAAT
jgi:hypothetical protein